MDIKIDGEQYPINKSELTVREILLLGQKPKDDLENYELVRVVNGRQDILYSRTQKPASTLDDKIPLQDGENFSIVAIDGAQIILMINSQEKSWINKTISYKEVVELAFGSYKDDPNVVYTVNYFNGPKNSEEGSLVRDKQIPVKNQMAFDVTITDKS